MGAEKRVLIITSNTFSGGFPFNLSYSGTLTRRLKLYSWSVYSPSLLISLVVLEEKAGAGKGGRDKMLI